MTEVAPSPPNITALGQEVTNRRNDVDLNIAILEKTIKAKKREVVYFFTGMGIFVITIVQLLFSPISESLAALIGGTIAGASTAALVLAKREVKRIRTNSNQGL